MKVKFVPQNIEFEITPHQTVKEVADKNNIFIKSICNGLPSCAECRVKVVDGEHNVLPPNGKELNLIGTGYFIDQRRLSCQLHCFGDVTIDLSEQVEKEKNQSAKRPQGSRKAETEVTHAVVGNLIEQENSLFKEAEPEQQQQRPQQQRQHRPHHEQRQQQGQQQGQRQQQNQRQQNQDQRQQQQNQRNNQQQGQRHQQQGQQNGQHRQQQSHKSKR